VQTFSVNLLFMPALRPAPDEGRVSQQMHAYVVGVAMTPFTSRAQGLVEMTEQVVHDVLADSGVPVGRIGTVFVANAAAGLIQGQEMIRGEVLLQGTPLAGLPVINVENACASASTAVHLAATAVTAGQDDAALVIGVEQMSHPDRRRTFGALASATDTLRRPDMFALVDSHALRARDHDEAVLVASPLMAHYADQGAKFLAEVGGSVEDLARVVAKNRLNGSLNPKAQLRRPVTAAQVLADPLVAAPLTRTMCSPVSNGAAAILVASAALCRQLAATPVRILGTGIASADPRSPAMPSQVAAERAYAAAGVGPDEIDVAELHDAAAPAELILMEAVGLCGPGRSIGLLRSGATALGGTLPVNPSGGLIARGHPLGATGCAQLVELTQQLRGHSGERQVESVRLALAQNSGGVLGDGEAVGVVTILGGPQRRSSAAGTI
jgi:acetyl-CoA acetyltransferase